LFTGVGFKIIFKEKEQGFDAWTEDLAEAIDRLRMHMVGATLLMLPV